MLSAKLIPILGALWLIMSCNEGAKEIRTEPRTQKQLIDSLQCPTVLAAFNEKDGHSWILCDTDYSRFLKVTALPGYPFFVDSLKKINATKFASLHYNYEYEIKENEVIVTFIRKVVHPSSNWQGQTPGKEFLPSGFARTDR